MEAKKLKAYAIIVAVSLIAIGFSMGAWYGAATKESNMQATLSQSIEVCEDNGQVLRLYNIDTDSVKAECYGELGALDVHIEK